MGSFVGLKTGAEDRWTCQCVKSPGSRNFDRPDGVAIQGNA